jgi:hypothetical protein
MIVQPVELAKTASVARLREPGRKRPQQPPRWGHDGDCWGVCLPLLIAII